jgi:hypothetical protein
MNVSLVPFNFCHPFGVRLAWDIGFLRSTPG